MSELKTVTKDSLKELYNESKKRVKMILHLLGRMNKDNQFPTLPDGHTLDTMANLADDIINSARLESDNQYRDAIIQIAEWMHSIFQKECIKDYKGIYPHPLLVAKKGAEILHSFLHRDLRRKQFSSEENEIYKNYLALVHRLSNHNVSVMLYHIPKSNDKIDTSLI